MEHWNWCHSPPRVLSLVPKPFHSVHKRGKVSGELDILNKGDLLVQECTYSLLPRLILQGWGREEKAPGTHCVHMWLITMEFHGIWILL